MIETLQNLASEVGLAAIGVAPAIDEVRAYRPWARSVICAAVGYLSDEEPIDDHPRGLVARIARSADYHDVLRNKLTPIAEYIKSTGAQAEICVDTSPIPERKLAVLSGIAWRGKNANVFIENCGSYAALGEIITDIDLPTSHISRPSQCGDCDACVRACPAGAIISHGVIDTTKCLSAISQSSEPISMQDRAKMGSRIYGCDTCQEACPHNAGILPSCADFPADIFPGAHPDLIYLIDLSAEEFRATVKDSSIGWIRRTRIRRNAAIAAANLKYADAIPALRRMLDDENPILREVATWAIISIDN